MKEILPFIVIGIMFILFFYFGYRDDYNRNPKLFVRTIIGVPIGIFSSIFGLIGIQNWIRKWMKGEK